MKLATELSRRSTGKTLYILDEPTTGLHIADVHKLLEVLQRLVGAGDSVVVIEHNLDVIKTADYIIDLGPEGGDKGGTLLACGTPEEVAKTRNHIQVNILNKLWLRLKTWVVSVMNESIAKTLAVLPDKPGVYIMRDEHGKIIYIGKAVVLKIVCAVIFAIWHHIL